MKTIALIVYPQYLTPGMSLHMINSVKVERIVLKDHPEVTLAFPAPRVPTVQFTPTDESEPVQASC